MSIIIHREQIVLKILNHHFFNVMFLYRDFGCEFINIKILCSMQNSLFRKGMLDYLPICIHFYCNNCLFY
ncbi:hypothetical protein XCR1_4170011 [Xenorhabdus cabanillasii JM26]|uniref:Uncharacterized protein n=1 Tax=Xenorhabdus cabanillasii JM26 TaxID=1427517 RepID=W1J6Z4_9GAMM|nr:hypothetical protein XCR1_4170011 [Xenorhabdus cabanillasii JM26]